MTNPPEVSFCIPAFNAAARIERCLRGVLAQQVPSREILVVDNCSTDDTVKKAQAILRDIPEATIVVNSRNLGRIENWNRCLELATGRFIKFALTNDVLLPGATPMLLKLASPRPWVVLVCSRPQKVQAVPASLKAVWRDPPAEVLDSDVALRRFCSHGNDTGSLGAMLIQGEPVRQFGLRFRPDLPYWADHYFAIELADCGLVVYAKAVTYLFDASAESRYARSGISEQAYYREGRECARLLARLLPQYDIESWRGFEYLHQRYARSCHISRQPPLSQEDTLAVFNDAGPYLPSVLKYRTREAAPPLEATLTKDAIDAGLYRFPVRS